jgi:protein-S-isoprenylcysteine O-methyltransferase Ste14
MEILNDVRYWLGVMVLATWAPAILSWALIHPLVKFWRKVGVRVMWSVIAVLGLSGVYALFYFRDALMGQDLGTNFWVMVPGTVLYTIGFYLDFERRKTLTTRILVGTPELENDASNLLTEGPFKRVRHPRYLAIVLAYFGFALFANFSGLYIYFAATMPFLYLIIILEENELRMRFGQAYEDYARKTPRIIPKLF